MDIRLIFIFMLSLTFVVGVEFYEWEMSYTKLFNCTFGAILMQLIFAWAYRIAANTFLSAIITALLIAICLRTDYYFYYTLASFFALSAKYIFQYNKRLIFNPTVFALFIVLTFMGNVQIGFFNMPTYAVILFVFIGISIQIFTKLSRFESSIAYLVSSIFMFYTFNHRQLSTQEMDWIFFSSIFIMLDRSSLPNSISGRILFGIGIGFGQYLFSSQMPVSHSFVYVAMIFYLLKIFYEEIIGGHYFYWNGLIQRPLNSN